MRLLDRQRAAMATEAGWRRAAAAWWWWAALSAVALVAMVVGLAFGYKAAVALATLAVMFAFEAGKWKGEHERLNNSDYWDQIRPSGL